MNIKKLVVTAAAGAVMLSAVAIPAFATSGVSVTNHGNIFSNVSTSANTGNNRITVSSSHEHSSNGGVVTGAAVAGATVVNQISTGSSCGCASNGEGNHGSSVSVSNNGNIRSSVTTSANTGFNHVNGGSLTTGAATAGSTVSSVVDTYVQ